MGTFIRTPKLKYINGDVYNIKCDLDLISYTHLLKYIQIDQYGKIESLSYKGPHEPLEELKLLFDYASTLHLSEVVVMLKKCDIFVQHGIDDVEVITIFFLLTPEDRQSNATTDTERHGMFPNINELPIENEGNNVSPVHEVSPIVCDYT